MGRLERLNVSSLEVGRARVPCMGVSSAEPSELELDAKPEYCPAVRVSPASILSVSHAEVIEVTAASRAPTDAELFKRSSIKLQPHGEAGEPVGSGEI
jgi:hypothetical protein